MNVQKMLHIIVSECENGCTDICSTVLYFQKHYNEQFNWGHLVSLIVSLNFDSIRKNKNELYAFTFTAERVGDV